MSQAGIWESLSTKNQENGIALLVGASIGVAVTAMANILKTNTNRGTYAISIPSIAPIAADGSGGIDADLLLGIASLGIGLFAPGLGVFGMGLVGVGIGAGTQILGREGAVYAVKKQKAAAALPAAQKTSGVRLISSGRVAGYSMPGYRKAVALSAFG